MIIRPRAHPGPSPCSARQPVAHPLEYPHLRLGRPRRRPLRCRHLLLRRRRYAATSVMGEAFAAECRKLLKQGQIIARYNLLTPRN